MRFHAVKLLRSLFLILLSINGHATKSIILLGSPGSGKGTQAEHIAKEFNLPVLHFGNVFRAEELQNSELHSRKIATGSDPILKNQLHLELFSERVHQGLYAQGLIFDSWPKDRVSLEGLNATFFRPDQPLVIELVVPQDIALKRGLSRNVCPNAACGGFFGSARPSQINGHCDQCHTALFKRRHDNAKDFPLRLKRYLNNHEALMKVYQEQGITVHHIDANRDPDLVSNDLNSLISAYLEDEL